MARHRTPNLTKLLIFVPLVSFIVAFLYLAKCNITGGDEKKACEPQDDSNVNVRQAPRGGADMLNPMSYKAEKIEISSQLVICIMTGAQLVERRYTIRETWLQNLPKDVVARFVVGTATVTKEDLRLLEKEHKQYRDIMFLPDLKDSYGSLTDKLIHMFKWLDRNANFQYVLKADDDTFVRVDALMRELKTKPRKKFYWGFFDGRAHVHRTGKWSEPDFLLCDRYLPYALGGGYIISSDMVHFVASNSPYLKKYLAEDVSLGSWLAATDVKREHDPRFDTEFKSRGCRNVYLVMHKQTMQDMRSKYQQLKTTGKMCAKEEQYRLSYVYNWDKLPTECCERTEGVP